MKKKSDIIKLEKMISSGKEVVDAHFNVAGAIVGRPRQFATSQKILKTNLDLTTDLANEIDALAINLNISRQAVIKMMIRQSLDEHYMAVSARKQLG